MVWPDTDSAVQTMPAMAMTKNMPVVPDRPNCSRTTDEMMIVSMVMPETGLRAVVAMAVRGHGREEEREEQCEQESDDEHRG